MTNGLTEDEIKETGESSLASELATLEATVRCDVYELRKWLKLVAGVGKNITHAMLMRATLKRMEGEAAVRRVRFRDAGMLPPMRLEDEAGIAGEE